MGIKSVEDQVQQSTENESTALYDYPDYYELAFSFRDIAQEVTCLEILFSRYA